MGMIFGRRPVLELLSGATPIQRILLAKEAHGYLIDQIIEHARGQKISILRVPRQEIEGLFPGRVHQGVVADVLVHPESTYTLEDLIDRIDHSPSPPFLLLLDGIVDPRNLGALVRTANAAGAQAVIIPKYRSAGMTPVVSKASAGAAAYTPIVRVANLVQTSHILKKKGFWVVGADVEGKELWYQVDFTCPILLVLGSEGKGIRRLLREECDFLIRLPMFGKVASLNVSVAGGILMYEMMRQRMTKIPGYLKKGLK